MFGTYIAFVVYDFSFVFGTDVMVTVAKAIDSPLKFVILTSSTGTYSCVGLGDIVIPGLLASLSVRIDLVKAYLSAKRI